MSANGVDSTLTSASSQLPLVIRLALREYRHEWVLSGCFVLALGALLVPLLVLFGLKFGVVSNLLDPLREDPRYRQVLPRGSGSFGPDWFSAMRERPDVEFVVPRTRTIAATMKLRRPGPSARRIIDVELIPSAAGDPMLGARMPAPSGFERVVLSRKAAEKLGVTAGARLQGLLERIRDGREERVTLPLQVGAVAPARAFARDGLFVSTALLAAVEDFRDGRAVPALGWAGTAPRAGARRFAGFRLFARGIDDVAPLRAELLERGIDVHTRAADIELVRTLERNLGIVYWIIAIIVAAGYCVSFGTSVWANVDRKRHAFSLLRLVGFRTRGILWFPIVQSLVTALLGWTVACLVYLLVAGLLNELFSTSLGGSGPICRLLPRHLAVTCILTLAAAALAASLGGWRVAQLEASAGLRED